MSPCWQPRGSAVSALGSAGSTPSSPGGATPLPPSPFAPLREGCSWRRILTAVVIAAALGVSGCSGGGAAEMLQTAQFEELQNNPEHAAQLYHRIVEKYPDSPEAAKARERLAALKPAP